MGRTGRAVTIYCPDEYTKALQAQFRRSFEGEAARAPMPLGSDHLALDL